MMSTRKAVVRAVGDFALVKDGIKSQVLTPDFSRIKYTLLVGLDKDFHALLPYKVKGGVPSPISKLALAEGLSIDDYMSKEAGVSHSPFYYPLKHCHYFVYLQVIVEGNDAAGVSVSLFQPTSNIIDTPNVKEIVLTDITSSSGISNEARNMLAISAYNSVRSRLK